MNVTDREKGCELTGYPSIDKPWLKYYSEEAINKPLPQKTLFGYLYDSSVKYPKLTALNYYGRKISYGELCSHIRHTAEAFAESGIQKGDIVTILSLDTPETIYCVYALNYLGAIANLVYLTLPEEEIIHTVQSTNSKVTIVLDIAADKVIHIAERLQSELIIILQLAESMPCITRNLVRVKQHSPRSEKVKKNKEILTFRAFLKNYVSQLEIEPVAWEPKSPAVLVYTSGTTGEPKGVVLTNDNINAVAFQYYYSGMKFTPGETMLAFMPPFFAIGFCLNVHMPLVLGLELILGTNPDPKTISSMYRKHVPNHFVGAPSHVLQIIETIGEKSMAKCFTLAGGGESLTPEQERKVNDVLASHGSNARYITGYGMTEFAATVTTGQNTVHKEETIGIPMCRVNVKIVDTETGQELPYNEVGEMCFHTPSQMKEYYHNPEETKNILRKHEDGIQWIHTGDLGFVDTDGFVHFKGRMKRIYLTQGVDGTLYKIFPARIEKEILKVENVNKSAVIVKIDDGLAVEQIAFVDIASDTLEESVLEAVREHCRKNLPPHSIPHQYIALHNIPLTTSGKIDYRTLEKKAWE